jgi:hypothetical protein
MDIGDRIDELDLSLFDHIPGTSSGDARSLLALHAAIAARGDFDYLEVGSYHGASLQALVADPRCRTIVSIDRRDAISPDERSDLPEYPDNTTAFMLGRLAEVPGADLGKLTTIEGTTGDVDSATVSADVCFIDAEHTNEAALQDARFCLRAMRQRGVIVFHDRTLVSHGIQRFLAEVAPHRAYPLAHDLFVVEIGLPTLLSDPRVRAQVPRRIWLTADRLRIVSTALTLDRQVRRAVRRGGS